jgi:hypothetical protein
VLLLVLAIPVALLLLVQQAFQLVLEPLALRAHRALVILVVEW